MTSLVITLAKLAWTLGPDVVKLIIELIRDIKNEPGADRDRKKAERVLFVKAWALKHGIPVPPGQ
jgi:hypothetical protein